MKRELIGGIITKDTYVSLRDNLISITTKGCFDGYFILASKERAENMAGKLLSGNYSGFALEVLKNNSLRVMLYGEEKPVRYVLGKGSFIQMHNVLN